METSLTNEQALLDDVAQLRERFPKTQDLYREVCTVLFFRYGITPTANKLYQYVKKGSMSAPTEALAKFWDNLREKSRVRIEHPDLPEEIKATAGELAANLWGLAQNKAQASLAALVAEARASVMEAQSARSAAESQRDVAQAERQKTLADLEAARAQIQELQQQRAANEAARVMLEEQLAKAQSDIAAYRQAQESARQYFAAEIEKLRTEAQLAEERFRSSEKRALLEIDRERSVTAKFEKELVTVRAETTRAIEQSRLEAQELQQQLGNTRQHVGALEGQLQAAKTNVEQLTHATQELHQQLTSTAVRAATAETERDAWRVRAEGMEKELAAQKTSALKRRRNREGSE